MNCENSTSLLPLKIDKTCFKQTEEISKTTYVLIRTETNEKYIMKMLPRIKEKEQFPSFCNKLTKLNYPFYLPLSYFNLGENSDYPSIFTHYMQNRSLKFVINQKMQGNPPSIYDEYHKYLILYNISQFLEKIHNDKLFHGNLKLSNILLDENFSPMVTDSFLYDIIDKPSTDDIKNKPIDFIISLPPEFYKKSFQLTPASDIYSFGIIILQVLTDKINLYSKNTTNLNGKIEIPDTIPFILREAIIHCLSENQKERKTAAEMKIILKQILNEKYIDKIMTDVQNHIDDKDIFKFEKSKFPKKTFIPTPKALERLTILKYYIDAGRPVILEGPTGTSKTLSVEIVCKYLNKKLIRINLSSEAKSSNLKGNYVGDSESWAGLKMKDGPYIEAYEKGYCLLLDEINLANPECLQFIEDTLDSGVISTDLPGKGLQQIKMNKDFRLIATQNPNKDFFAGKRKELSAKFLSRFQVINFPKFEKDELLLIAKGLAKKLSYNNEDVIKDLVDFHMEWSEISDKSEDIQCFTVREIASTVKSLSIKGYDEFDIIMTIYGARYQKEKKNELETILRKYKSFQNCVPKKFKYPDIFSDYYQNKSLSDALKSVFSSFSDHRNVILAANEGAGVTKIAHLIAQYYNEEDENKYYCLCTEETKCIHLIGNQKPSDQINSDNNDNELIQWKPGFLLKAIVEGHCAILDNIDQAPPTVSERLNSLLDKTYDVNGDNKDYVFEVPENPKESIIKIHKKFHLLCTCKIDNINKMSPAFINRFDVIVLEDQIDFSEKELKKLITILLKQSDLLNQDENNLPQNAVDLIYQKVKPSENNNQPQTNKITMFQLSQLCRAVIKYSNFFPNNITVESIVNFAVDLLDKNKDFNVPKRIESFLLSKLKERDEKSKQVEGESKFFFQDSPILKSFIAKLFALSLINVPVCIYGPTGVGKTSAAREFAKIRPLQSEPKESFSMFSFHAGTKPNYFYGTTTINNKKIQYINGALTTAMIKGQTFIADELNLSSESTMKSIAPALEPITGQFINISGIDEPIKINPDYFFIVCQNERGTLGRNPIPLSIVSRFRNFDYPKQNKDDISIICSDIAFNFYKKDEVPSFSKEEAKKVGEYMMRLNDLNKRIIPKWSLRDITKIFLRIHHQDKNSNNFIYNDPSNTFKGNNMKLYMNLLFYTLSPINEEDIKDVLHDILELLCGIFELNDNIKSELEKSYINDPTKFEKDGKEFLMKGNFGIMFDSFTTVKSQLPSLLNGVFQILLSDPTEPILIMGPSGFKTFLSQLFLKSAKIITLNQESTVQQLLGSSTFLTKDESKIFYIKFICRVCNLYNDMPTFIDKYHQLKNSDIESFKKEFLEIVLPIIPSLPKSFKYSIEHLISKLFDENTTHSSNCILSNLELEFRPGLFLWAILEGKSLILKDLSNLPTIVLERFNELFSAKQLTVNEDIHNTITDVNEKELTDFDSSFRVIATCHPNSLNKLSEAVLSRFSVISVPSYKQLEQKIVLNSYISLKKLQFDQSNISKILEFSSKMYNNLKKNFSFPQIITCVEMCSRLNSISKQSELTNIGIILYRLAFGLFENKTDELKSNFLDIFKELKIPIPATFTNPIKSNPLKVIKTDSNHDKKELKYDGIKSEITNVFLQSPNAKENDESLAFTEMFSEMIDILHLGISLNVPVIFEGMPGQGKQTAINYISKMLGYNVINIILSKTTKVEDLLGKITIVHDENNDIHVKIIETKIIKVLKSIDEYNNSIVVFQNINNASSAVLAVLATIFDHNQAELLLPNGSTISKGHINLVGIFNPQNGIFNRDRLPSSLIFSSIYHIVSNPSKLEILEVVKNVFQKTAFCLEAKSFFNKFIKTKKYAEEEANTLSLTLNDIIKYTTFRKVTYNSFDENFVSLMIFAYRFIHQDDISAICKKIGLIDLKSHPEFNFNLNQKKLFIKISENSKTGISLDFKTDQKENEKIESDILDYLKSIASLTIPQKHCILFLACCFLSQQSCIIQGGTASGKSFLIRLFAKMLGRKLNVYQMNNDTGIGIITGQSYLSNELSEDDIKDLENAIESITKIESIKNVINDIVSSSSEEWKRTNFSDLLEFIKIIQVSCPQQDYEILEEAAKKINETIQPAKRFHFEESSFIKAMINGEWILIDGIESAPPEFIEKISSLCGQNPELDLFECGEKYFYTRNGKSNSQKIHKDFHLFITYNPTSQVENKQIDPNFFNKCATFTLPSIDATPECSAQILVGTLLPESYPKEIIIEISKKMAKVHSLAKNESEKDSDSFAADNKFTGRSIKFISDEFIRYKRDNKDGNEFYQPIINSIKYYYLLSYINTEKKETFKTNLLNEFKKKIDDNEFADLKYDGINIEDKYRELLYSLRNIQLCLYGKNNSSGFNFSDFIQKCLLVKINDLPLIQVYVKNTIKLIDDNDSTYLNTKFDHEYNYLKIIESIFDDIIKETGSLNGNDNFSLNDDNLLENEKLDQPLSRFKLLSQLAKNESKFFTANISRILFNSEFVFLMKIVANIVQDKIIQNFTALFHQLSLNPDFISLIDTMFPYNLFNNSRFDMINYIIPMFRNLHESKISFHVVILDQTFDFKYNNQQIFEPTYIFEENLILSSKTHIKTSFDDIFFNEYTKGSYTINYFFYNLTNYLIKNPKKYLYDIEKLKDGSHNPRSAIISKLSFLFSDDSEQVSLISKIWSFLFSFPANYLEIFSKFLQPLERETLKSFYDIFTITNKKNVEQINEYSIAMIDFGKENSYLWKIKNDNYSVDLKILENENLNPATEIKNHMEILKQIQSEIEFLEKIHTIVEKQIQSNNPNILKQIQIGYQFDIQLLIERVQIPIKKIISTLINNDVNSKLRAKLDSILEKLEDVKTSKEEFVSLKLHIRRQIEKDSKESLSEQKISFYEKRISKFTEYVKLNEEDYNKNNVMFPKFTPTSALSNKDSDPKKRLYEHILWFSTVNDVLDKIIKLKNEDIFQVILQLSNYKDTDTIVKFLINRFLQFDNFFDKVISSKDKEMINHIFNACLINKFINDCIIDEIDKLQSIFNDLEKRNSFQPEIVLDWIHKIANHYPPDFELSFPKFKPNDLLFLYIEFDNDNFVPGPLLKSTCEEERAKIINIFKEQITKDFDKAVDCSVFIGKTIYEICVNEEDKQKIEFLELIKNTENKQYSKYKDKINDILSVMKIAEKIDSTKSIDFNFDDTEFLDDKCLANDKFIDAFPSFAYWLAKNDYCTAQLRELFSKKSFTEQKETLPFLLFAIRLMSSFQCIKFECPLRNEYSKNIQKTIENTVKNTIKDRMSKNEHIGIKWLNLLLSSLPDDILDKDCQMFRQFLINLSEDGQKLQFEISKEKNEITNVFIKNICNLIFDDKLNLVFDLEINSNDDTQENSELSFIKNPNNFICSKIEYMLKSLINKLLNDQDFLNLCNFSENLQDSVNEKIKTLKNLINEEEEIKVKNYNDEFNRLMETKIENKLNNLSPSFQSYQKILILSNSDPDFDEFQKICSEIIICTKNISYIPNVFDKKSEKISLLKFEFVKKYHPYFGYYDEHKKGNKSKKDNKGGNDSSCMKFIENEEIVIQKKNKEYVHVELKLDQVYYFYEWQITKDIKNMIEQDLQNFYHIISTPITLYQISSKFDLNNYCKQSVKNAIVYQRPSLKIGKYSLTPVNFIKKIEETSKNSINVIKDLKIKLNKSQIDNFYMLNGILEQIKNLLTNFTIEDCPKISDCLNNSIKPVFDQLYNYISLFKNNKIKNTIQSLSSFNSKIAKLFDKQYRLPILNEKSPSNIPSVRNLFKNIKNTNFFSNPILSVENGSIVCCYKSLDCTIGPIMPSLYSNKIIMNFISFIEETFTIEIKTKDKEYSSLFPKKKSFSKFDPVQISISLPHNNTQDKKTIDISTEIIFNSEKPNELKELKLPCVFRIITIPVSLCISCMQCQLSYNSETKSFYLCKNKLLSSSKLIFSIKNYFLEDQTCFKYQLLSLDGNNAPEPTIQTTLMNNGLELTVPKVDTVKRLHGEIKLKLSDSFSTSIIIDAIVIPFVYSFDVYDLDSKTYSSEAVVYYSTIYLDHKIKLHFRINGVSFFDGIPGKISVDFPKEVKNAKLYGITPNFIINEKKEFDITFRINGPIKNNYNRDYSSRYYTKKYSISLDIYGVKKSIFLEFRKAPLNISIYNEFDINYINKFDVIGYKKSSKEWEKIHLESVRSEYHCFVSPFSYELSNKIRISYDYNNCQVVMNTVINNFISINSKGDKNDIKSNSSIPKTKDGFIKRWLSKLKDRSYDPFYYPIYGVVEGQWFPVYKQYPKIKWNLLEINEKNVKEATKRIKDFEEDNKDIDNNNFLQLFKLLRIKEVIMNIKDFIQELPNDVKKDFDPIIAAAEQIDINDNRVIILSHNAIIIFLYHFEKRFNEIKKNYYILPNNIISQEEIDRKVQECYEKYCQVDKKSSLDDLYLPSFEIFKKIESSTNALIPELELTSLQVKPEDSFLYIENSVPSPKEGFDIKCFSKSDYEIKSNSDAGSIPIELPKENDELNMEHLTISTLNNYFQFYIKIIRLFPNFVSAMLSENSEKMEKEAINYFMKLLQIYDDLPEKDFSFISVTTNLYCESFVSMIGKLKKAGVNFGKILPSKCKASNEVIQDFFSYPEKDKFFLPPNKWLSSPQSSDNRGFDLQLGNNNWNIDINGDNDFHPDPHSINDRSNQESNNNKLHSDDEIQKEDDEMSKLNIEFIQLISEMASEITNENENSNNKDDNNPKIALKSDKNNDMNGSDDYQLADVVSNDIIGTTEMTKDQINDMASDMTDEMAIERLIYLMNYKDKNAELNIPDTTPYEPNKSYLLSNDNNANPPIVKLMQQASFLASKFIATAADMDIPLSQFSVNILADCSRFIKYKEKLYNMMIICALTQALDSLGIPYSAAVYSDKKFKCIIKEFNEPHSPNCLQKICDCLLIERFCSNLANSVKFAIDHMKYSNDNSEEDSEKEEKPYRAIFVFTNGLDEQLKLTNSWKNKIFNDENISFGFIFIQSPILNDVKQKNNMEIVKGIWDTFEAETNEGQSVINIAHIKAQVNDDLSNKLINLFKAVMSRTIIDKKSNEDKSKNYEFNDAKYTIDRTLSDKRSFESFIKANYSNIKSFYINSTQVLKSVNSVNDKLNPNKYAKHLRKIATCKSEINMDEFVKKFLINRRNIDQSSLETVFRPNKANQYVLSTIGTDFDIIALVLYLINPTPEPMIYLEQTGGLIRNYAVTIVIDPSYSCFDNLSGPHSLQTIRTIISSLASLDLNCFDLIVAGNPNPTVVCSEVGTINALSNKSALFESLFSLLQDPLRNVDLGSAIHTAFDLKRMRYSDCSSILFVLTNGLYQNDECDKILNSVNCCVLSGISVFGIGIGIYPKGIEKLFPQVIFSPNPSNVMKAVASFYSDSMYSILPKMTPIGLTPKPSEINSAISILIENENKPTFASLKDELTNNIMFPLDAFVDTYNEEQEIYDDEGNIMNPVGKNTELYVKDYLKTQKILIVMLWDKTLNLGNEAEYIDKKYIDEPSQAGAECIKTAVGHFGITLKIVQNYEDAINEITKQSTPGYCDYYAVWVFCGPPLCILPEKGKNPHLVGQFIDVLILFWKNGGSIVFWAEGEPLTYQVNLFLETVEFENEPNCPSGKTKLHIGGEHDGRQILLGEVSDTLSNVKTFNRSPRYFKQIERPKLSNNIRKIFEGITISYAEYGSDIKPFKPFSRDSEGGYSALFYSANIENGTGDIIIDCGYTKCFTEMQTEGTFRYVQNIAGWTARPEVHRAIDKKKPSEWRPKAVEFKINKNVIWYRFQVKPIDPKKDHLKTLWAIDSSESVSGNDFYHTELNKIVKEYYHDNDEIYLWDNTSKRITIDKLRSFISNREGGNGTKASKIAEIIEQSKIREHLLIVTDGSVFQKDIAESDEIMQKNYVQFQFVTTFVIKNKNDPHLLEINRQNGTNYEDEPDLSVGAAYSRGCQSITYSIREPDEREEMASLSSQAVKSFDNMPNINTFQEFMSHFVNLANAIQSIMLGKPRDESLLKKLDDLYDRIRNKLNDNDLKVFTENINILKSMANGGLLDTFGLDKIKAVHSKPSKK